MRAISAKYFQTSGGSRPWMASDIGRAPWWGGGEKLELALLHLGEERAALFVVLGVAGLGLQRAVVLAARLLLLVGHLVRGLLDQPGHLVVIALRHRSLGNG